MSDSLILIGAAAVVAIAGPWIAYTVVVQGNAWRTALRTIAQQHGLKYVAPKGAASKKFDLVHGEDRGIDVTMCTESISRGDSDSMYSKIEASISPSDLVMMAPGRYETDVVDFSEDGNDAPTPTGISDFDRSVEVRRAKKPLLERLRRDPVLRAEIMGLVNRGLQVRDGDVALIAPFPKKAAVTLDRYEKVVALARTITELEPD